MGISESMTHDGIDWTGDVPCRTAVGVMRVRRREVVSWGLRARVSDWRWLRVSATYFVASRQSHRGLKCLCEHLVCVVALVDALLRSMAELLQLELRELQGLPSH